jgi:hypothetical protein
MLYNEEEQCNQDKLSCQASFLIRGKKAVSNFQAKQWQVAGKFYYQEY